MLFLSGKSLGFAGAMLLRITAAYPQGTEGENISDPKKTDVGDSWTSGVTYSAGTLYKKSDSFHAEPNGDGGVDDSFLKNIKRDVVSERNGGSPENPMAAGPAPTGKQNSAPKPTGTSDFKPKYRPCVGNQVNKCMSGLQPAKPYGGKQAPACARADGSKGSLPRLNEKEAEKAATAYCKSLIKSEVVLKKLVDMKKRPYPLTFKGTAEDKKTMTLYVSYDVAACPKDKKTSELDFKKLGQKACEESFNDINKVCVQDKKGKDYNKDFTLMGGVYRNECAIWSLNTR